MILGALGKSSEENHPVNRQKPRAEAYSEWAAICLEWLGWNEREAEQE